jgi:HAE1 family hydrophobic/amphiphilic exporter-1
MSKFFIERPIFANVIAIIIVLLGAVCLFNLPVSQYPNIVPPTIQVSTTYTGASADVIANTIGIPIEQAVNGVENSIYMQSTSGSDGSYTLTVTFGIGTDLDTSLALVQNAVNAALPQLPQSVRAQGVNVKKVSANILLIESLYTEDNRYDEKFLSNYAVINLQYPLERLPGVGQVTVFGAGPYSMRIWLDPNLLKAYGLSVADVHDAIAQQNVQVSSGSLGGSPAPDSQLLRLTVNTFGRLSDVSGFEDIVVKSVPPSSLKEQATKDRNIKTAALVRLRDIAKIELDQQVYTVFSTMSGKKAANIAIFALPGANALQVADGVRSLMTEMSKSFPEGLKYNSLYDTTLFINQSIDAVYSTLLEAGALVLIVIMIFLQNVRAMLIPALTVPVTIIGAFAAMALLGFTVNLMTLFALILAIGIVVDDAIIIVENTSRYIEEGLAPKEATIKAMSELTGPIFGVTLVLVSVFLPASFMPGITGQMFRQFALVMAATAMISALNALTLNPAQCALLLRARKDHRPNIFFRGFNAGYARLEAMYVRLVRWMTGHAKSMACIFFVLVGFGATGISLYPSTLLPLEDQGYCIVTARLPVGASQPRVQEVSAALDKIYKDVAGLKGWVTIGGYSALDSAKLSNVLTTFIVYDDWGKRPNGVTQPTIMADLQARVKEIRNASVAVMPPSPIPGLGTAFGFSMVVEDRSGHGIDTLEKTTQAILRDANGQPDFLRAGITTFSAHSPQLYLDIDRDMARSLGVPVNSVFETVQTYIGSTYVNLFNLFNQSYQVRIQASPDNREHIPDIGNLTVPNASGQMVPLGSLMSVQQVLGSELLTRYNLYPAATVTGIPTVKYSTGEAMNVMDEIAARTLPQGMDTDWTGLSYQEELVGNTMVIIFALSIVLVFLVLSAQYESWIDPIVVILVVPVSLVGIIIALFIKKLPVDLYTQIGLVLMVALAAKNAILIVEFARELTAGGMSHRDAAIEATRRRFRPILMTSFAFILGVLPLVTANGAGAASQQSIGTVVFGGMIASTLIAIPFVPVFYVAVHSLFGRKSRSVANNPQSPSEAV